MKAYVLMWSESAGYDCDCQCYGVTLSKKVAEDWWNADYEHWAYEREIIEHD